MDEVAIDLLRTVATRGQPGALPHELARAHIGSLPGGPEALAILDGGMDALTKAIDLAEYVIRRNTAASTKGVR